jgi:hypothetical protein
VEKILLKNVWVVLIFCLGYIVARQGWPSPFIDTMFFKTAAVCVGTLLGYGVDSVHFKNWKPSTRDTSPVNMLRRAALIIAGMFAVSLAV